MKEKIILFIIMVEILVYGAEHDPKATKAWNRRVKE